MTIIGSHRINGLSCPSIFRGQAVSMLPLPVMSDRKKPKPVSRAYQPGSSALSGEDHGRAILTDAIVMSIRQLIRNGASVLDIARTVGVAPATISKAARGITWGHLPNAIEGTRVSVSAGATSKTDRPRKPRK